MPLKFNKGRSIPRKYKGQLVDLNKLVDGLSRASQRSSVTQTEDDKKDCVRKMSHLELSTWNGVKLSCTQSKWYHVTFNENKIVVAYGGYKEANSLIYEVPEATEVVDLPCGFVTKLARKPVCIGSYFPYIIVQYQTPQQCDYTRFLFVDLKSKQAQTFEDSVQYFQWNFLSKGVVECLLSPSMQFSLFLLPMNIKSDRKWSKLLCSRITKENHQYKIDNVRECGLQDRRNQAAAIFPDDGTKVLFLLVDSYCSFCKIKIQDFETRTAIEMKVSLSSKSLENTSSNEDEAEDEVCPTHYYLLQCSADFCQSGEIIVLTCLVQKAIDNACRYLVKVFQLSAVNKTLLNISTVLVPRILRHQIINIDSVVPFFSSCDTQLSVWFMKIQEMPVPAPKPVTLVKKISLKSCCRVSILRKCNFTSRLHELPLPMALINYLRFGRIHL